MLYYYTGLDHFSLYCWFVYYFLPTEDSELKPRVVNGKNADKHEWPFQVYITRSGQFICGGSIIKRNWVLTAAHCVKPQPQAYKYRVTVGMYVVNKTISQSINHTISQSIDQSITFHSPRNLWVWMIPQSNNVTNHSVMQSASQLNFRFALRWTCKTR